MNLENITYYNIVRFLHLIGMAAWFGTALCVSIIWSRKNINDKTLILDLITKVEMPASFFIPLTGVLMSIDKIKKNPDISKSGFLVIFYLQILLILSICSFNGIFLSNFLHFSSFTWL